jgi:hypothetical protein
LRGCQSISLLERDGAPTSISELVLGPPRKRKRKDLERSGGPDEMYKATITVTSGRNLLRQSTSGQICMDMSVSLHV